AAGRSNYDDFFQTRAGLVYLMGLELTPMVPIAGERALVRVDLRQLRPELFASDEDTVQGAAQRGERWWRLTRPLAAWTRTSTRPPGRWGGSRRGLSRPGSTRRRSSCSRSASAGSRTGIR